MRRRTDIFPVGVLLLTVLICLAIWCWGIAAITASKPEKDMLPPSVPTIPRFDCTILVDAPETIRADPYNENIPLDRDLQAVLRDACAENDVPLSLALGLIEVESGFQAGAVSTEGCFGLCQLNPKYFPADLSPSENIEAGIGYLGELLSRYDEDAQAALTAYNAGHDTGNRTYAQAVLDAAAKWAVG